jgi:hypothetical protein
MPVNIHQNKSAIGIQPPTTDAAIAQNFHSLLHAVKTVGFVNIVILFSSYFIFLYFCT